MKGETRGGEGGEEVTRRGRENGGVTREKRGERCSEGKTRGVGKLEQEREHKTDKKSLCSDKHKWSGACSFEVQLKLQHRQ